MNDLLKVFVAQTARELVYEHDEEDGGTMDTWKFRNSDIEKLADLIVQECNKRANQYIHDCGEVGCLPERILEEHFGIV